MFDDGTEHELVCLDGTIPVKYNTRTYNIPMQLWLPLNFPYERPIVFVRPTQEMVINPSSQVDLSGAVRLPFLDDWSVGRSDLCTLVQVLQHVFAENPPVFAKQASNRPTSGPGSRGKYTCTTKDSNSQAPSMRLETVVKARVNSTAQIPPE